MARYIDSPELYLRKGKKVIVRHYYHDGIGLRYEYRGEIVETPRLNGKFATASDLANSYYDVTVKVKSDKGVVSIENGDDCYPLRDVTELSREDWMKLRSEICLGSVYIGSYDNSFGVDPKMLCDMCEMYLSEVDDSEISTESFARYMAEYAKEL